MLSYKNRIQPIKQLFTAIAVFISAVFVTNVNAQTIQPTLPASTRICGPFGCELIPVPDLPKPLVADQSSHDKPIQQPSQKKIVRQKPSSSEPTSKDLYCETMTIAFFESALDYKPPSTPEHAKRVEASEREMLETCKSMPTIGGKEKIQRNMTPQELSQISCLGIADGIATAHASKTEDRLLYSKLSQQRQFFSNACISNREAFLGDMKKYGPYHVLNKTY